MATKLRRILWIAQIVAFIGVFLYVGLADPWHRLGLALLFGSVLLLLTAIVGRAIAADAYTEEAIGDMYTDSGTFSPDRFDIEQMAHDLQHINDAPPTPTEGWVSFNDVFRALIDEGRRSDPDGQLPTANICPTCGLGLTRFMYAGVRTIDGEILPPREFLVCINENKALEVQI